MKENVVIGFCTNMAPDGLKILCRSIREHLSSDNTEIVLIPDHPERYEKILDGWDVSYRLTPSDISIASELLGYVSIQTTEHHYIPTRGTKAHRAVQSSILDARAEALERLRCR
jgi:hypothetical protein